jgi:hypothetical protein
VRDARIPRKILVGAGLLHELGGLDQHRPGDGQADRLGGLEVDDEVECGRRLLAS